MENQRQKKPPLSNVFARAAIHLDPGCRPRPPFYRFPEPFYRILQNSIPDPTKQESNPESAGAAAVTLAESRGRREAPPPLEMGGKYMKIMENPEPRTPESH